MDSGYKPEYTIGIPRNSSNFTFMIDQKQPNPGGTVIQVVRAIRPAEGILLIRTTLGVMIVNQTGYLMSFCRREEEIYIYPYASIEFKKLLNTQNCLIRKDKESDEVVLTDAFNIILNDSEVVSETPDVHDYKTEILTSESGRWFRGSTIQRNHKPDGRFAFKVSTKPPPIGSCWKWTLYLHCIASDVCLFRENSRIAIQNTTGSEIILKHFNSSENQKDYTHPETTSNEVKVGHQSLVQFQNLSGKSCLKFHVVVENQNYFLADAFRSVQQP